ncbi:hypothetical protein H5410_030169 [Solanum commersonii]|uniref:Uncharacterized protein n=1 Tax=Solanum commersonii TaxID=4109 RepID=A0A9J5YG38_SOLCO|nr:hypothetical protein H5410_030169 [Solanum commersonii]
MADDKREKRRADGGGSGSRNGGNGVGTMSIHDQAEAVVLSQIVMAADGTHIGLALASILKFKANSSPFTKSTTHHRLVSLFITLLFRQ